MNWFIIATKLGDSYKSSNSSGPSNSWAFFLVGGMILLLSVGWYYWNQQQKKKTKQVTKKKKLSLFQELCSLHKISALEKGLLQKVIHQNSLKPAALAFLDPAILSQQAEKDEADADKWITLKEKLFGSD